MPPGARGTLDRRGAQWAAPPLWRSEWRNVLTSYLRRDLLKLPAAIALMQQAEALLAAHDEPVASEQVLQLATSSWGCRW